MAKYIKFADVQLRLIGKVRFQDDSKADQDNRMPVALANRLIVEAEGQVEMDLSPRYAAPFVYGFTDKAATYDSLPDSPTKNVIKTLCELQAVIRILETDFGSGTAIDAQKYISGLEKRYRKMIDDNILAKFDATFASSRQWKFPPLPFLALASFNREADDGFAGMVIVEDSGEGAYPSEQINDPSQNFFDGKFFDQ